MGGVLLLFPYGSIFIFDSDKYSVVGKSFVIDVDLLNVRGVGFYSFHPHYVTFQYVK